jgi:hypothetical protein
MGFETDPREATTEHQSSEGGPSEALMSSTKKVKTEVVGIWTEDLCEILGSCELCNGRAKAGNVGLTDSILKLPSSVLTGAI